MNGATKLKERHGGDRFIEDNKDTVHRLWKLREFMTKSLVDAAADAVATDGGFEDFFRDDNSKTLVTAGIRGKN